MRRFISCGSRFGGVRGVRFPRRVGCFACFAFAVYCFFRPGLAGPAECVSRWFRSWTDAAMCMYIRWCGPPLHDSNRRPSGTNTLKYRTVNVYVIKWFLFFVAVWSLVVCTTPE